jgi:hypothetical protein
VAVSYSSGRVVLIMAAGVYITGITGIEGSGAGYKGAGG